MKLQYTDKDCHVEPVEKPFDYHQLENAEAVYLMVTGMGCPRCATRINNSLLRLDGVLLSEVLYEECFATVAYDPDTIQPLDLIQAVADAGNGGHHHYEAKFLAQGPASRAVWEAV